MSKFKIICGVIAITFISVVFALVSKSFAFFASTDKVYNAFGSGDVNIEIKENFNPPSRWNGENYTKEVAITNSSNSDALIRVSIIPRWVDENGNPWPGDISFVKITFVNVGGDGSKLWVKDNNSDYYYYDQIVPKNESTKDIVKSVSANIPDNLKSRYKDKTLVVDVKSEAVQASKKAYATVWSDINNSSIKDMLKGMCKY